MAIASLLAAAPARAQGDKRAIVNVVTKVLDGIRTRDTTLMRAAVVAGERIEKPKVQIDDQLASL